MLGINPLIMIRGSPSPRVFPLNASFREADVQQDGRSLKVRGSRNRNDLAGGRSAVDYVFIMTLEPLHPLQAQRLAAMSAAEKWEVAKGLLRTARQTRRAGLALRHPDWSAERIEQELAREIARART